MAVRRGLGEGFDQKEADAILSRAKELGINLIDTAECYGPDHMFERFIGDFLKRDRREDWVWLPSLATDGMINGKTRGVWTQRIAVQLEQSLRALQTDLF